MAFLAPAFLAGLLALAIPVLIHLSYRRKTTVVEFPSLMFLQKVPFRSMKRQKLRHWLLFLTRCAAIVMLVLAFSRPFIDRPGIAAALTSGDREVVILLDNSHSMAYRERWEGARRATRAVIDGLGGGDRASLVVFSDSAQLAVRSTSEAPVLIGALEATAISSRATRYAPALRLAQRLLEESDQVQREVVLVTDFQRSGWDPENAVRLPEGTAVRTMGLRDEEESNLAVADLLLQRQYEDASESLSVAARLTQQGEPVAESFDLVLEVNGEVVETLEASLEADSAATFPFAPIPVGDGRLRGTVRAGSDALATDNDFHFVVEPGRALSLLIVEPANASATDSLFLRRALELGSRPVFQVDLRSASELGTADLEGRAVVILNDAPFPRGSSAQRLRSFVEQGGGLIVALGELSDPEDWSGSDAVALAPGFGEQINRDSDLGGTVASFDADHPIFEVFTAPRSGDFTSSTFYRYRPLQLAEGDRVLASFDDGTPALAERSVGAGRVLVWVSTFDTYWNDIPQQPVFLPLAHQLAKHAAGYSEASSWYVTGEPVDLADLGTAVLAAGTEISITSESGDGGAYRVGETPGGLTLPSQGLYELDWVVDGEQRTAMVASNLDRSESDLARIDPEELAAAVAQRAGSLDALSAEAQVTPADRESRQAFWWYLLVAAVLLLIAETTLSNRLTLART